MIKQKLEARAEISDLGKRVSVWIFTCDEHDDPVGLAKPVTIRSWVDELNRPPTAKLNLDAAQQLFNDLYKAGFRPES